MYIMYTLCIFRHFFYRWIQAWSYIIGINAFTSFTYLLIKIPLQSSFEQNTLKLFHDCFN